MAILYLPSPSPTHSIIYKTPKALRWLFDISSNGILSLTFKLKYSTSKLNSNQKVKYMLYSVLFCKGGYTKWVTREIYPRQRHHTVIHTTDRHHWNATVTEEQDTDTVLYNMFTHLRIERKLRLTPNTDISNKIIISTQTCTDTRTLTHRLKSFSTTDVTDIETDIRMGHSHIMLSYTHAI